MKIRAITSPRVDLLTRLDGCVPLTDPSMGAPEVSLRYVPDRAVLDPESVAVYLSTLAQSSWAGPEDLALAILDDLNNEAVPRWVQVRVVARGPEGLDHRVVVEDHQPQWRPKWSGAPVGDTGAS